MDQQDRLQQIKYLLRKENNRIRIQERVSPQTRIVTHLHISRGVDVDLSFLKWFPNLKVLIITDCDSDIINLKPLKDIQALEHLEISENPFLSELDLQPLQNVPSLVSLTIRKNGLKKVNLEVISNLTKLIRLDIRELGGSINSYDPEQYSYFSYWSSRRYYQDCESEGRNRYDIDVQRSETYLKELDLSFLSNHPSLKIVDAKLNGKPKRIKLPINPPLSLEELDLSHTYLEKVDLNNLISDQMKKLLLKGCELKEVETIGLDRAKVLTSLSLRQNQLKTINLAPVKNLYSLQELDLSRNRLLTLDLDQLENTLYLHTLNLESNDLTAIDLKGLENLKELSYLRLGDNKIEQIDLSPLAETTSLEILRLTRNKLVKLDLKPLSNLQHLRKLQVARNKLIELSLEPLRGCKNMDEINLDRNEFQKLDISAIEEIPLINFIDLRNATTNSKLDITAIITSQDYAYIELDDETELSVDVDKIKDKDIKNRSVYDIVTNDKFQDAVDYKNNSKKLLDAKTDFLAKKAIENHEDVIDLLTQRLIEKRSHVSSTIRTRLNELKDDEKKETEDEEEDNKS